MAIAVIHRPLLAVDQHGVRFRNFFEFLLCVGIIRVAIRVVLHRELAVGTLDFLLCASSRDPKHLVIIAFSVTRQNGLLPACESLAELLSVLGILRNPNHGRTQQAILQLVATLQLIDHLMIGNLGSVYHLDRFMDMRIEPLSLGGDGVHPKFG